MQFLRQLGVILFFSFLGELLHVLIPLPVPASVYGLLLLLLALCTGIVKLEHVRETAGFLIEIMPVMFIPAAVGLLEAWPALQPVWVPVLFITAVSTVLVMAATGRAAQRLLRGGKSEDQKRRRK